MANAISLTVFQDVDGVSPQLASPTIIGGSQVRYYASSAIQEFHADSGSGISGVQSIVSVKFAKGNGTTTGALLVAEASSAIATAMNA